MEHKLVNKDINTYKDDNIPPGMLSSPQIEYCVDKYRIIKNFEKEHLGPATYHMRIGGPVVTWDKDKKIEFTLGAEEDKNRSIYKTIELKPNSLTFVTTIEEFCLTKDIIARYNLKSALVHQGLLLGTGPIVDPQLHARLLIPIHNFSNKSITLQYNDELISVEFTKTSNPDKRIGLSNGDNAAYIPNKSWDFDFDKYRKRIGDKEVASSVRSQFQAYGDTIDFYKNEIEKIIKKNEESVKKIEEEKRDLLNRNLKFNVIALLAVIVAICGLFYMSWDLTNNAHNKADEAYNLVKQYKDNSIDFRSLALKTDLEEIRQRVNKIEKEAVKLNSEALLKLKNSYSAIIDMINGLERKTKSIDMTLEDLKARIKQDIAIKGK